MENVFDDYLNKRCEMLSGNCSCGKECFIFVKDSLVSRFSVCKKCGKKIYFLECDGCGSGFSIPENYKTISNGSWKCEVCDKEHNKLADIQIENYTREELPKEISKKIPSDTSIVKLIILSIVVYAIIKAIPFIKDFINKNDF